MAGAPLAEGEEGENYEPQPVLDEEQERRQRVDREGGLWRREEEEEYYGQGECGSQAEAMDGTRYERVLAGKFVHEREEAPQAEILVIRREMFQARLSADGRRRRCGSMFEVIDRSED